MASAEDTEHIRRLIKGHKSRLRLLELRKAKQGDTSDPSLDIEIDDLRAVIADLEQHQPTERAIEARQALRNQYGSDMDFLMADGAARNRRQTKLEEVQANMATQLHELNKHMLAIADTVHASEKARLRTAPGYRRALLIAVALSVLSLIVACAALVVR